MTTVAVVAHRRKTLGGGLDQLRTALAERGVDAPLWFEIDKSRKATKRAARAAAEGAEVVFAWGGDGTVQRCVDALAGTGAALAILPAGTANLLASNLDIPKDIEQGVRIGLAGHHRDLDVGRVNGERFLVMAGIGFDALMIRDADSKLKARAGRGAYIWTAAQHLREPRVRTRIIVDGTTWFHDDASCVLIGNVGTIMGGITAFESASPDDGRLEVGVVTARGIGQWSRVWTRVVTKQPDKSPLVQRTAGTKIDIELRHPLPYELDGGARPPTDVLKVRIEPGALPVCTPLQNTLATH
jgi:YegS/Rv2252/BmrU family lipid kinase